MLDGSLGALWQSADGFGRLVALLLFVMSVTAWALMGWRAWSVRRARRAVQRGVPLVWAAPDWSTAQAQLAAVDTALVVQPLLCAAREPVRLGTLEGESSVRGQRVRRVRSALQQVLNRERQGLVVLASIGATAPFVGLLGTVWGIQQALVGLSAGGPLAIERIAGPVGEALVMTAAGLVVAIPAVLGYNALGRAVALLEADLDGFAHDLCESDAT